MVPSSAVEKDSLCACMAILIELLSAGTARIASMGRSVCDWRKAFLFNRLITLTDEQPIVIGWKLFELIVIIDYKGLASSLCGTAFSAFCSS